MTITVGHDTAKTRKKLSVGSQSVSYYSIAAAEADDYSIFERLLKAVEQPYVDRPEFVDYQKGPQPEEKVLRTFCGT